MAAVDEFLVGFGFIALLAIIVAVNLFLHRNARRDATRDSEILLAELRLVVEDATQSCRLEEIRRKPEAFSARMQGFDIGPASYYKHVRFEIFDGDAPHASSAAEGAPLDSAKWRCRRDAVAAGITRFDRDYEGQLERMFFAMQSGEGVYEAVYCKAGDFMSTGGGILKLSFSGRHLGIVNFGADGTITDAANRRAGTAKWDGAAMTAALRGKKYVISRPEYTKSAFRIMERGPGSDGVSEDDRMLLLCLSLFCQVYRRARRVARDS